MSDKKDSTPLDSQTDIKTTSIKAAEVPSGATKQTKDEKQASSDVLRHFSSLDSSRSSQPSLSYVVASHSVRITQCGFALEPIELRYPEIANNLTVSSRRTSEVAFDNTQIGYRLLNVLRGFWSQPGFSRGKQVKFGPSATMGAIMREFNKNTLHPHTSTYSDTKIPESPDSADVRVNRQRRASIARLTAAQLHMNPHSKEVDRNVDFMRQQFPNLSSSIQNSQKDSPNIKKSAFFSFLVGHDKNDTSTTSPFPNSPPFSSSPDINSPTAAKNQDKHKRKDKSKSSTFISWIPTNKQNIFEQITQLCAKLETIFASEPRILNVDAPCIVLGDIHGNLHDLRTYERSLWPKAPNCMTNSFLFLGDYVDRGEYSVECVLYLFAMKVIAPHKFFLLRGNHEISSIQKQYTFSRECETKFGSFGKQLWKTFNKVFNVMPIAAIVDNEIFCAHGGIPKTIQNIKTLSREIPKPLINPEIECPSAWEILWNDPITDSELIGMVEMDSVMVLQPTIHATTTESTKVPEKIDNTVIANSQISNTNPEVKETQNNDKKTKDDFLSVQKQVAATVQPNPTPSNQTVNPETVATKSVTPETIEADKALEAATIITDQQQRRDQALEVEDLDEDNVRKHPSDTSSIASATPQAIIDDGFISNIKRGTAYLFSDRAVHNFMNLNGFSHIIRAHEVIPTGFAFHGNGKVITIFSSSRYCGLNNQAACALIDKNRIRIMRLDTNELGL